MAETIAPRHSTSPSYLLSDRGNKLMISTTKLLRRFCIALACCGAISCTSSDDAPRANIALNKPLADRQILAFENSTLRADISVNGGPVQSFTVFPGESSLDVGITGVVINANNTITVKWTEFLNGFDVEISDQSQSFFADGDTQINATHQTDQYDYDNDGASNSEERSAGTCVWSANEACLATGQLDVPDNSVATTLPPEQTPVTVGDDSGNGISILEATVDTTIPAPNFDFDFSNADDLTINGDFSGGRTPWQTQVSTLVADGQTLCAIFPASDGLQIFENLFYYGSLFDLDPGRYAFTFDIHADRESIATFALVTPNRPAWIDQPIDVSETPRSYEIFYEHLTGTFPSSAFALSALRHPTVATTFCIDNFRFLKER